MLLFENSLGLFLFVLRLIMLCDILVSQCIHDDKQLTVTSECECVCINQGS